MRETVETIAKTAGNGVTVLDMAARKITKTKKKGRPPTNYTKLDPRVRLGFSVSEMVYEGLQRFCREIERREGRRITENELARRIVNSTMVEWLNRIERGELDIHDQRWRPPC